MSDNEYASVGGLLKYYFCRSKVLTVLIVFLPFLFSYGTAVSNISVLNTPELLLEYISQNQGNALLGVISASTMAAATVWRVRIAMAVIVGALNIVLVVGGTRRDEELGRLELLRSGAVGVKAPLAALFIKMYGVNFLGGVLMASGFIAAGFPIIGSIVSGLSMALCWCCIGVIAGICAQISPNARIAHGLSFGAVAVFMVFQTVANVVNQGLLLFNPLGWCAYSRAFAGENFWVFPFAIFIVIMLTFFMFVLYERRDVGGSYLREQKGRASAMSYFKSPFALAWRLQRNMLLIWLSAYALMGIVIASLKPNIEEMLAGTNFLPELSTIVGGPGNAFLIILSYILTHIATAYAIMAFLRIREEETLNRTEMVLSSAGSRLQYATGHILIAFIGSVAIIALFGVLTGDFTTCITRIPAVWTVASIPILIYGILPRATTKICWSIFGALLGLEFLWELKLIGNNIFQLSPFAWVYPGATIMPLSLVVMIIITAICISGGLYGFSKRDIITE